MRKVRYIRGGLRLEDDYWPQARDRLEVIVEDDRPADTGLLDEFGVRIFRVKKREKLGF